MMSPAQALHDPTFQRYLVIVPVALACGGLILTLVQYALKIQLGSIWATYRSWIVMAILGLLVVAAGRIVFILGITALSIFAFREFARASDVARDRWLTSVVYACIIMVGFASLSPPLRGVESGSGWHGLFAAMPALAITVIVAIPIFRNRARGELQKIAFSIAGFIYVGWMFGHLGFLANTANAYGFVCFIIFATEITDISAYTFGRLFGRHPLRSQISPGKTIEGAIGALIVAMILPWALRFSFPFFGATQLIVTGLIVGIGALVGDLSISMMKREVGTKDMGTIIPGHGGILDRIDSLIFVAPLFTYMIDYYYGLR
jgi:phosphatidate cytidylyltransferase